MKKLIQKIKNIIAYFSGGVWQDTRDTMGVRIAKTATLAVNSFLDRDLQQRSMSLTYSTVLAIVPAFALLFAIGRGFGFQKMLESSLYAYLPAQSQAITTALGFVDSYLQQASQSIFVGAGILMLLWTLVSLLSNIERSFNMIWDIKKDRSMYRKVTDYIAICLLVPILIVCSSSISIFMSTTIADRLHLTFLTPLINILLEASPIVLVWGAFSISFFLFPNTKVNFKYAAISGLICAISFQILQLLFVNGQIYVSKYNAIYGSFAFLPLLLIWLQLSWLILLAGCVLTYSLQNIFTYNYLGNVSDISDNYIRKVSLIMMAVIVKRFINGEKPLTRNELSMQYDFPIRIVNKICDKLYAAKLIYYVVDATEEVGVTPAVATSDLTVEEFFKRIDNIGASDFIPDFRLRYSKALEQCEELLKDFHQCSTPLLVKDLQV